MAVYKIEKPRIGGHWDYQNSIDWAWTAANSLNDGTIKLDDETLANIANLLRIERRKTAKFILKSCEKNMDNFYDELEIMGML